MPPAMALAHVDAFSAIYAAVRLRRLSLNATIVRENHPRRHRAARAPPGSGARAGRRADGGHDLLGESAGLVFPVARGPEHQRVHLGFSVQGGEGVDPTPDRAVERVAIIV